MKNVGNYTSGITLDPMAFLPQLVAEFGGFDKAVLKNPAYLDWLHRLTQALNVRDDVSGGNVRNRAAPSMKLIV